jgi:hypothetical protein
MNTTLLKSPIVPDSALGMKAVLMELLKRKSGVGDEYQLFHSGKSAEARLRDEIKRRLNLQSKERLPDDVMKLVEDGVKMFNLSLMERLNEDGFETQSASYRKPFVKYDGKTAVVKDDGLRNQIIATRELRGDGERLVCYQEERRKCAARIETMRKNPAKYSPEDIQLATERMNAANLVCQTIAPETAKTTINEG